MRYFISILLLITLSSCFEEDIPVKPAERGEMEVITIPMTPEYSDQFFFSFSDNAIIKQSPYDLWDLAFQCYGDEYYVILNTAKFMETADMGEVPFESIKNRTGAEFKYDSTNGDFEDYSIGKWWIDNDGQAISKNHIYIINRGRNIANKKMGYVKVQFLEANENEYTIRFADVDGKNENTVSINRDSSFNYMMFSFDDDGQVLEIEPKRTDWDMQFTKMMAFLPYNSELLPYGVTGILINHTEVAVYSDSLSNFSEIDLNRAESLEYSTSPGVIGHEWKDFDLNGESYSAKIYKNYILRDRNGFYWKFRFLDFYNDDGLRGYPKFEFIRL